MTGKQFRYVLETVESEGFDYTFTSYSDFEEIEDEEFHRLRQDFLDARRKLAEYIGLEDE